MIVFFLGQVPVPIAFSSAVFRNFFLMLFPVLVKPLPNVFCFYVLVRFSIELRKLVEELIRPFVLGTFFFPFIVGEQLCFYVVEVALPLLCKRGSDVVLQR